MSVAMLRTSMTAAVAAVAILSGALCGASAGAEQRAIGPPPDKSFVTRHRGVFGGQRVSYTATIAPIAITDDQGRRQATITSIAFTRTDGDSRAQRPVMFLFNGGPGASSSILHLSGFGPRRISLPGAPEEEGRTSYAVVDNEDTPLERVDLVFIDPIGTGFSRALPGTDPRQFFSLQGDAASIAQFIRKWLVQHGRNGAHVYIVGESYGTVRAAVLTDEFRKQPLPGRLAGLILIGQALDTTQTQQTSGNDMPYVLYLSSYAATAWYHGKIDPAGRSREQFMEEVRAFALNEYAPALLHGSRLLPTQRKHIAERVAAYTALPVSLIEANDLRIGTRLFLETLGGNGKPLLRADSRFAVPPASSTGMPTGYAEGYANGIKDVLRELAVPDASDYRLELQGEFDWDFTLPDDVNIQQTYNNVSPMVVAAMKCDPNLRVFVASGEFDLMASPSSAELTYSHNGFPTEHVELHTYPAGHMPYIHASSRKALMNDIRAFIARTSPEGLLAESP